MIQTVWLDNPPVNAVNSVITNTLWDAFENLDDDVRAVVLRGRGERAFSAGADISGFVGGSSESERPAGIQPVADLLEAAPVPVVAAIHGYCLGGGLELALACDFRIATRDAQLGFPEVNLGLLPGGGGTQRAPRLIGSGRAAWLIMSGERIPAEQAASWGLVEFVVDDLDEGIAQYVEPLGKQSPHAIRQIKQLLNATRDVRSDEREVEAFVACLNSEDGQEGVAAFLE
jgi:enoyl-CoA hydratase/3-hydroxyacyl-CoA dehydrogenase